VDVENAQHWDRRGHFFAAEAMRPMLVDVARRKQRPMYGGGRLRIDLKRFIYLISISLFGRRGCGT
jgi:hypothetical protein